MDFSLITNFIQESLFVIFLASGFLVYVLYRGRQSLINLIFGLYLGLLFVQNAPFSFRTNTGDITDVYVAVALFITVTIASTLVIANLMPDSYREKRFESFGKKLFLVASATILAVLFSFHVVPVHELLSISSPISGMFSNPQYFFWWLLGPFVLLYFHK